MKKNNESAFPIFLQDGLSSESHVDAGLTKREWFAGLAMQGLLAGRNDKSLFKSPNDSANEYLIHAEIAKDSIAIADAILEELEKF